MNIYYSEKGYEHLNSLLQAKKYSTIFVLTDHNTNEHCSPVFLSELATHAPIEIIEIEAGEEQKNISTCLELWNILSELQPARTSLRMGLGGRVATEIPGVVAAVSR